MIRYESILGLCDTPQVDEATLFAHHAVKAVVQVKREICGLSGILLNPAYC